MTAYKYWVSGITYHIYSREERTRLTGEINDMSAFIPGAERYFRRSLHVKNCRDRLIISSGFQEKGGCPLIRACSVITSNTVPVSVIFAWETKEANVTIVRVVVAGNCSAHAPAAMPWTKPSDHLGRVWNARGKYSRDCLWHK